MRSHGPLSFFTAAARSGFMLAGKSQCKLAAGGSEERVEEGGGEGALLRYPRLPTGTATSQQRRLERSRWRVGRFASCVGQVFSAGELIALGLLLR